MKKVKTIQYTITKESTKLGKRKIVSFVTNFCTNGTNSITSTKITCVAIMPTLRKISLWASNRKRASICYKQKSTVKQDERHKKIVWKIVKMENKWNKSQFVVVVVVDIYQSDTFQLMGPLQFPFPKTIVEWQYHIFLEFPRFDNVFLLSKEWDPWNYVHWSLFVL